MSFEALQTKSSGHVLCGSVDEVLRSCHVWLCRRSPLVMSFVALWTRSVGHVICGSVDEVKSVSPLIYHTTFPLY